MLLQKKSTKQKKAIMKGMDKKATRHTEKKQQKTKVIPISNYFKCKWTKLSNRKAEIDKIDLWSVVL